MSIRPKQKQMQKENRNEEKERERKERMKESWQLVLLFASYTDICLPGRLFGCLVCLLAVGFVCLVFGCRLVKFWIFFLPYLLVGWLAYLAVCFGLLVVSSSVMKQKSFSYFL